MVVRMRHTRAHTRNRRSHHRVENYSFSVCKGCGAHAISHRACPSCGLYRGRTVLDTAKKSLKKEKKAKQRETQAK